MANSKSLFSKSESVMTIFGMAATFRMGKFLDRLYSAARATPRNVSRLDLSGRFPRAFAVFAKIITKYVGFCASGAQPSLWLCKTPGHMFSKNRSSWRLSENLRTSRLFLHSARRISHGGARQKANGHARNEARDDSRDGARGIRGCRLRKRIAYSVSLKKRMASAVLAKKRIAHGARQRRIAHGVARRKNEGRSMMPVEKRMAYNGSRQKSR